MRGKFTDSIMEYEVKGSIFVLEMIYGKILFMNSHS